MDEALVFYTNPMSRGRIVRWMLEEVGRPYDTRLVAFGEGGKDSEFLKLNPMGKVPTVVHGGVVVTECAAICAYLADAFPEAGLAPPLGDRARAPYFRWMFFAAGPIEAASTNKALGFQVPPGREVMAGYGSFEATVDVMETAIAGREYVAGDRFTAADVYFGSQVAWGLQFGWLEKRPAFTAYSERLAQRPAAVRAREIDDALIAQAQAAAPAAAAPA